MARPGTGGQPGIKALVGRLRKRAPNVRTGTGYVDSPVQNLLPGVHMGQFQNDLLQGAGHELQGHFCAAHSSSALAVNTFAWFKHRLGDLQLLGWHGFDRLQFEYRAPTGLGGTPPNLDVALWRGQGFLGIESKLLEYFTPKQASFADRYNRQKLPDAEDCWWDVLADARQAGRRHLDVAQLVKHYFGLIHLLRHGDQDEWKPDAVSLIYLYWEPKDADQIEACIEHRRDTEQLKSRVACSHVHFQALCYLDLWREWLQDPALANHAQDLLDRYGV